MSIQHVRRREAERIRSRALTRPCSRARGARSSGASSRPGCACAVDTVDPLHGFGVSSAGHQHHHHFVRRPFFTISRSYPSEFRVPDRRARRRYRRTCRECTATTGASPCDLHAQPSGRRMRPVTAARESLRARARPRANPLSTLCSARPRQSAHAPRSTPSSPRFRCSDSRMLSSVPAAFGAAVTASRHTARPRREAAPRCNFQSRRRRYKPLCTSRVNR